MLFSVLQVSLCMQSQHPPPKISKPTKLKPLEIPCYLRVYQNKFQTWSINIPSKKYMVYYDNPLCTQS